MTTCSVAASSASSSSWRSSLRASRSPVSGSTAEHVVAVDDRRAREDAVVEADQADHAVRDRPHRDHGADGEGAGAEVGAGGSSGQPRLEHRPHVGQPELEPALVGGRGGAGQLALELRDLPRIVGGHVGEGAHACRAVRRSSPRRWSRRAGRTGRRSAGRGARRAGRRDRSRCCRRRRAGGHGRGGGGRHRSWQRREGSGRGRPARCCARTSPSRTPTWPRGRCPSGHPPRRPTG